MLLSIPQNRITLSLNRRLSLQKIFCQPIELAKYATRTLSWGQSSVMDRHLKYLRMTVPYGGSTVMMQGLQEREKALWDYSSMLGINGLSEHLKTRRRIQRDGFALSYSQGSMTSRFGEFPTPMTLPHGSEAMPTSLYNYDYASLEERVLADAARFIC